MPEKDRPTKEQAKAAKAVDADAEGVAEEGNAQVQQQVDAIEEKGYLGYSPDPTPRDHYTVKGVGAGKPTPETDEKAAAKAQSGIYGERRGRRV
jgi:hypothetical protein